MGFDFEKRKLIGCDPDNVTVLLEDFLDCPRVTAMIPSAELRNRAHLEISEPDYSSHVPFVCVPPIAYRCYLGTWISGEWMKIQPIYDQTEPV